MRFVDSGFEIINQEPGMDGLFKHIEKAGRVAYKSEDRITDNSAEKFVKMLAKNAHGSVLEHGTVYLYYEWDFDGDPEIDIEFYESNPYSKVVRILTKDGIDKIYITTNYRVIVQNHFEDDLQYMCEPTKFHEKRYTVKFITSIGITREIIRHRKFTITNESTRYVNYSKGKFGSELTFVIPQWIYNVQAEKASYRDGLIGESNNWLMSLHGEELVNQLTCEDRAVAAWVDNLERCEKDYMYLLSGEDAYKLKPEEARGILPMDTKSEIVITAFKEDWIHFFNLRSYIAMTGRPHPDIMILANKLLFEFEERKYINHEEVYRRSKVED